MKNIFRCIALQLLAILPANAQPGCPDPQATNYNSAASTNDGSCLYPVTSHTPVLKCALPGELREISGLTQADNRWWGHSDSGANETFYSIELATGNILQEVKLDKAQNHDWEDIAATGDFLYVGDFGNNFNDRQNLGIYKIPIADIGNGNSQTVQEDEWSLQPFAYADQTDFSTQPEDSSVFDCEAMIVRNGWVQLFTKSRRNYNTVHYRLNPLTGLAEPLETFDCQGLITGASLSPDGKLIALVGYDLRPFIPTVFCWLLWDWQAGTDLFFSGNKRRIELGTALQVGQVESIGFETARKAYISNERTAFNGITLVEESVRSVDFGQWVPLSVGAQEPNSAAFSVYPNPFSHSVRLRLAAATQLDFLRIKNLWGQTVATFNHFPEEVLALDFLPPGAYIFEAGNAKGETWAHKIFKSR